MPEVKTAVRALTIIQAVNDALKSEMERDPTVVVFGEDVGKQGGVFRATVDLQQTFGSERCFDTPISESGIVGSAIGMAISGLRPVVEIQFSGFIYSALEQMASHAARMRNRTRAAMTVPLVLRMPYGGGIQAPELHSESMEAVFGHIQGLKVVIPSTPYDAKGLLVAAIRDPDPVIFMEPKRIYRSIRQEVPEEDYAIEIGRARVHTAGEDLTVVSYGAQMLEVSEAVEELRRDGTAVELIELRTIYPFDAETVCESVKRTGRLLVVHEGPQSFGVAAEIITTVIQNAFEYLEAPPARLTGADTVFPLPRAEAFYVIGKDLIVKEAKRTVAYQP
jgi:pyruvate dehydrogenase E1 component beta subunit